MDKGFKCSRLWFHVLLIIAASIFLNPLHHAAADSSLRRSPVVVAVEKVSPAVVNVSTLIKERVGPTFPFSRDDFFSDFFSREYTHASLGSGVIIDGNKGYIITNHHVVAKATEIKVITADKKEYQAKILGSDPRSDLAVLKIDAKGPLPEIKMGDSDDLMIGETVIAIGNPFGLSHSVTTGVVSALNRSVRADDRVYRNFIQTDAAINPGNSGGPLLDIEGELVGINTAIYQKAQGIGFAIPINKAKRIVKELLRVGEVRFPWVGVEVQELTPALKAHFALPEERNGLLVRDVVDGSPAAKAGIKRGDILLDMGGMPVASIEDYRETLAEFTPSDSLKIGIFRDGKDRRVEIQLSAFPLDLALALAYQRLGIEVGALDRATGRQYGVEGGVIIEKVRQNSEAGRIGLDRGDLILKVNNMPISDLEGFKKAISRYRHLSALTLVVRRGPYGYSLTLPF